MINIVYSEFIKLKKSYILAITLLSGVLIPGIIFTADVINNRNETTDLVKRISSLEGRVMDIERISNLFLYIIIFSLAAAYIFSREYTDKTANILYTYPIRRNKIFFGKLITIYLLIVSVYVIQIIAMYFGGYMLWGVFPTFKFVSEDIKVNIFSILLQFLLIPIPILIANITRNIVIPIVYGLLGNILVALLLGGGAGIYSQFCPLTLPILPFYHFHNGDPIDFIITIGNAVITFSLFMFLSIYHYRNIDMD